MQIKVCSKCKLPLPIESFALDSSRKDGHRYWCTQCRKTQDARSYNAGHYKKNIEKRKAYDVQWSKEHPENRRAYTRRRRARKAEVNENFTTKMEKFVRAFWANTCAVCGSQDKPQIDHWRPLAKGFALDTDNAVILCKSCNGSKHDHMPRSIYSPEFVDAIEFKLLEQEATWKEHR